MPLRRRGFLAAGLTAVTLAGCTGDDGSDGTPESDEPSTGTGESTETGGAPSTVDSPGRVDLDLREANVTVVDLERSDNRTFDVAVTLYHDDDGEDGYANWWQVESLDGERLGRRDLLHAYGTREFTRSAAIEIPEGVSGVVTRGHDRTHGYGGQTMFVNVKSGATVEKRQGSNRVDFSSADCP